ncbi:uncharacterized protein B0T15DRAFT_530569 [Chaetomium strumarium]|uniref:Uncharacterized protein n=1 Tax=Chaetomium strumarium TaxID=1170767 RepID=A0AAJ0GWR6_9PEZI|nr:hypothetical protein B0T15DRAFT_530569 [Chaetomium strumarium]
MSSHLCLSFCCSTYYLLAKAQTFQVRSFSLGRNSMLFISSQAGSRGGCFMLQPPLIPHLMRPEAAHGFPLWPLDVAQGPPCRPLLLMYRAAPKVPNVVLDRRACTNADLCVIVIPISARLPWQAAIHGLLSRLQCTLAVGISPPRSLLRVTPGAAMAPPRGRSS